MDSSFFLWKELHHGGETAGIVYADQDDDHKQSDKQLVYLLCAEFFVELMAQHAAEHAARALRTTREAGFDRAAYAAKGLRCAGDHLRRCGMGREPLLLLLRPCQTDDSPWALPAAFASLEGEFRNLASAQITCADQIPGCIAALKPLMQ